MLGDVCENALARYFRERNEGVELFGYLIRYYYTSTMAEPYLDPTGEPDKRQEVKG